jgi:hypothetical protein
VIPLDLQSTIISELQSLFEGQSFPKMPPKGGPAPDPAPLNIFSQALPQESGGDPSVYMPYIIVQVQNGKQAEEMEPGEATVVLHIGIYDDDTDNQGHAYVCNIIETIYQDLFQKRTLGGKYFIVVPFEWAVNDEDLWPTFIGAIESHWNTPIILSTDPNL